MAARFFSIETVLRMATSTSWPLATRCVLSRSLPRAPKARKRVLSFRWANITCRQPKQCARDAGNVVSKSEEQSMKQVLRPATTEEVREIVGPLDDLVLLRLV